MNTFCRQLGMTDAYAATPDLLDAFASSKAIGRIGSIHRNRYEVYTPDGIMSGHMTGRLLHEGIQLCAGDWVEYLPMNPEEVMITRLFPRVTFLSRSFSDKDFDHTQGMERQGIVANIDRIFIVVSTDHDFSLRRIERYLVCAKNSGAAVCILINKIDKTTDPEFYRARVQAVAAGVEVILTSIVSGQGFDQVRNNFRGTVSFVGSSGVGKSSIINHVLGVEEQKTGSVREKDGKGRHTTTSRDMILGDQCVIIDNPGLREIQVWADETDLADVFAEIETAAIQCRYSNCSHTTEQGCAVIQAVQAGTIEQNRLRSYVMIQKEIQRVGLLDTKEAIRKSESVRKTRIKQHLIMKGKA